MRQTKLPMKLMWIAGFLLAVGIGYWTYSALAQAQGMPEPMVRASAAKTLTKQERWKLDFIIANEAGKREFGSQMFPAPQSYEKRARWFEEHAQWYQTADLIRQIIDFRFPGVLNNESAFNRLYELGKQGDIGASCMASMLYLHHSEEMRKGWKYSHETVVREALKHKDSGHPVCDGLEYGLYVHGLLGYPQDRALARKNALLRAHTGFYGTQNYLSGWHRHDSVVLNPKHFALSICWVKVAEQQIERIHNACETYQSGRIYYGGTWQNPLATIPIPEHHKKVVAEWCDPKVLPTIDTCMTLENQLSQEK